MKAKHLVSALFLLVCLASAERGLCSDACAATGIKYVEYDIVRGGGVSPSPSLMLPPGYEQDDVVGLSFVRVASGTELPVLRIRDGRFIMLSVDKCGFYWSDVKLRKYGR